MRRHLELVFGLAYPIHRRMSGHSHCSGLQPNEPIWGTFRDTALSLQNIVLRESRFCFGKPGRAKYARIHNSIFVIISCTNNVIGLNKYKAKEALSGLPYLGTLSQALHHASKFRTRAVNNPPFVLVRRASADTFQQTRILGPGDAFDTIVDAKHFHSSAVCFHFCCDIEDSSLLLDVHQCCFAPLSAASLSPPWQSYLLVDDALGRLCELARVHQNDVDTNEVIDVGAPWRPTDQCKQCRTLRWPQWCWWVVSHAPLVINRLSIVLWVSFGQLKCSLSSESPVVIPLAGTVFSANLFKLLLDLYWRAPLGSTEHVKWPFSFLLTVISLPLLGPHNVERNPAW